jgi:hypothetical protein
MITKLLVAHCYYIATMVYVRQWTLLRYIAVLPRPLALQPPLQEQLADMQVQLKEAAENDSGVLLTSVSLAGNTWAFRAVSQ